MNASNSKLSAEQKEIFKGMKADFTGEIFSFPEAGLTIAIEHKGLNTSRVAMSVMSPDETKFRRKVGKYHALSKLMYNGEFMTVPRVVPSYFAITLAEYFGA